MLRVAGLLRQAPSRIIHLARRLRANQGCHAAPVSCLARRLQSQERQPASPKYRTHLCKELQDVPRNGQAVRLAGWMQKHRRTGDDLVFITLRDAHDSHVQVKVSDAELIAALKNLPVESVLTIQGHVCERPSDTRVANVLNGNIEVEADSVEILNICTARLPFEPYGHENKLPSEDVRLKHRALDLRRPLPQRALQLRSQAMNISRRVLVADLRFTEIETPTLFKRTPGGAKEFFVPSQEAGKFYTLVQSPQQYKQMLMVGGVERYMQFARCYRNEGGRLDRQPEFTQLDLEMAFVTQQDVQATAEAVVRAIWKNIKGIDLPDPIPHMTFQDAINHYGVDKPDTRYDMRLQDVTRAAEGCGLPLFDDAIASGSRLVAVRADNTKSYFSQTQRKKLEQYVQGINTHNVKFLIVKINDGKFEGSLGTKMTPESQRRIIETCGASNSDVLFLACGPELETKSLLGKTRVHASKALHEAGLLHMNSDFNFHWIVDFPMFELEDGVLQSSHHPFTAPHPDDLHKLMTDPTAVRAQHFDLVVNGIELGGGSIRIHQAELQRYVIQDILKADVHQFAQIVDALELGAPPHGGIALGFDRLLLLLLQSEGATTLRDVLAFPKSFLGRELMSDTPCSVSEEELKEYHIQTLTSKDEN